MYQALIAFLKVVGKDFYIRASNALEKSIRDLKLSKWSKELVVPS